MTNKIVKNTLYNYYCGGETLDELNKTIDILKSRNINSMVSYGLEEAKQRPINETLDNIISVSNIDGSGNIYALKLTSIIEKDILKVNPFIKSVNIDLDILFHIIEQLLSKDWKIAIDAENIEIQQSIDIIANILIRKYNKDVCNIYKTYQCYLTATDFLIKKDISENIFPNLGIKLVRGAYLNTDGKKYPDKIFSNKNDVDNCYNDNIDYLMNNNVNLIVATHNGNSIKKTLNKICHNKDMLEKTSFAQLYGMADDQTDLIIKTNPNIHVLKHVTYGKVDLTLPYLIRRLDENRDMLDYAK